jgi:mRNA degradation ribonuclease J1/J2
LNTFGIGFDIGITPIPNDCKNKNCDKIYTRIDRAHVSGHASRTELKELIELVNPNILIPIHTLYPEIFKDITEEIEEGIEVLLPVYGKTYTF